MIEHVLDLDTKARICGMTAISGIRAGNFVCPVLALFDFAAAFPSVAHLWLFAVLAARGCPGGFINLIRQMYTFVSTYYLCDGEFNLLLFIFTGVLQGCPLRGMLFAFAMDRSL